MATVIRFARHGTKKRPYFRLVVQDHTRPRDGRFIEHIGAFDPVKSENSLVVERERLEYWLSTGAQMSTSVKNRLRLLRKSWQTPGAPTPSPVAKKAPKVKSKSQEKEA